LCLGLLKEVYDRIGIKLTLLAGQVHSRGISLGTQAAGDSLILAQLRVLNEASALLGPLVWAQGVHPLPAYLELCRLVGQLAIFGRQRRVPDLPRYDHDDLGGCFNQVRHYIDDFLDQIVEPDYKERPFEGAGLRMQVVLEPAWLETVWQTFVGVQTPLPAEDCVKLLTRSDKLDMKIGSSERVDRIFQLGERGLKFTHTPVPPRALPSTPGLFFFQVDRNSQQEEWDNVRRSLTLAIRLNEKSVLGTIDRQRVLTIRTAGGPPTTVQFTLYIVRGTS
jgi:type VI secretion system protein ImpJ